MEENDKDKCLKQFILCYRILNNKTRSKALTRNTVLSILTSTYAFMLQIEIEEDFFSNLYNARIYQK